ncbi:MAG: HAMP domain-containing histidine kinase [Planctomycetia bacterium]|nr:HAMP domain-containing histidine kinase [Planctomycetia bacterium]
MNTWLRRKAIALAAFLIIAGLVTGGLGWVTLAVLRLEQEQLDARLLAERDAQLRPALWQLDNRIAPILAREDSRPYHHYSAVYAPSVVFHNDGKPFQPGQVVLPSPLVNEELPEWMLLHFQVDVEQGWGSPQVLSQKLCQILENPQVKAPLDNITEAREQLRLQMAGCVNPKELMSWVKQRGDEQRRVNDVILEPNPYSNPSNQAPAQPFAPNQEDPGLREQIVKSLNNFLPQQAGQQASGFTSRGQKENDFYNRQIVQDQNKKEMQGKLQMQQEETTAFAYNTFRNGEAWFSKSPLRPTPSQKTVVKVGGMVPLWVTPEDGEERLLVGRVVEIGDKQVCQGILLDWSRLQIVLAEQVREVFPEAKFAPQRDALPARPERTMTALPVEIEPGPPPAPEPLGLTPLRLGLGLSWLAALVALTAVGLGGSSLLTLSERRIRFVSAVTHELRTPLTTLRLYLDMLAGGLVQPERQADYLQTLHSETDRLNRLVSNVLDFSRLERQRPRLEKASVALPTLLDQVQNDWQGRCKQSEKELVVENETGADCTLQTDVNMVQQILGNLIDNACKYSKDAENRRVWLRARVEGGKRLVLEVEDHGPGVPLSERGSIFRPFRRGQNADVIAGGVGLGLALAQRWAKLLGGKLALGSGCKGGGACFRLELPLR